jgi:alpha-beta hydrolase superfamily lysophospholipase
MHGTGDIVTDPSGSRELYARAASTDKTLHLYSGLYHEIFSEPERERVIGDLIGWIESRSSWPPIENCDAASNAFRRPSP